MGIPVEPPTLRKTGLRSMLETSPTKGKTKGAMMDHDSVHWGAFENLAIDADQVMSHPTRFNCADSTTLASSPGGSSKLLISPSATWSSPLFPSSPLSATSPTHRGHCVDPFGESVHNHRRLRNRSDEKELSSMSFKCDGELRPSRWDSEQWSGRSSFEDASFVRPKGNNICKCAAGVTADVAVVCCCPFSLLHLLAIAFIKVPAAVLSKTVTKVKHKFAAKKKRETVYEEEEGSIPSSSYPPSRCRSYEAGDIKTWAPALAFGDQKMWKDCFDSPDTTGVWSSGEVLKGNGELLKAKS